MSFEDGPNFGVGEENQRFVLLRHELPRNDPPGSHWDLILEFDSNNFTLQLLALPPNCPPSLRLRAKRLADHRSLYFTYEGPISGDRGQVERIAWGYWQTAIHPCAETMVSLGQSNCIKLVGSRLTATIQFPNIQSWRNGEEKLIEVHGWRLSSA